VPLDVFTALAEIVGFFARTADDLTARAEEGALFDDVAGRLGLEKKDGIAWREHEGVRVEASHVRRDDKPIQVVVARLLPAVDLGLVVEPRTRRPDGRRITLGDPRFDGDNAFLRVWADEPKRAGRLLGEALRDQILAVPTGYSLRLTDGAVRLEEPGAPATFFYDRALPAAAALAKATRQAADVTPPAAVLVPQARRYQKLAAERGLEPSSTPLGVFGRIDGHELGIFSVRRATRAFGARAVARLGLTAPLTVETRYGTPATQDEIPLDDDDFTRALRVRGTDEAFARRVLDRDTRDVLLDLAQHGTFELSQDALSIDMQLLPTTRKASRLIDRLSVAIELLRSRASGSTAQPYR
jgi:hypothetical protein